MPASAAASVGSMVPIAWPSTSQTRARPSLPAREGDPPYGRGRDQEGAGVGVDLDEAHRCVSSRPAGAGRWCGKVVDGLGAPNPWFASRLFIPICVAVVRRGSGPLGRTVAQGRVRPGKPLRRQGFPLRRGRAPRSFSSVGTVTQRCPVPASRSVPPYRGTDHDAGGAPGWDPGPGRTVSPRPSWRARGGRAGFPAARPAGWRRSGRA